MADEAVDECEPIPESSLADVLLVYDVLMSKTSAIDFLFMDLFLATAFFNVKLLTSDDTLTGRLKFICTRMNPSNV